MEIIMKRYNLENNLDDPILTNRPWLASHANELAPIKTRADVKKAADSFSLYEGEMSFEAFKSKLTNRAKALGFQTSLPKSWKKK